MAVATSPAPPAPSTHSMLRGRRLPGYALPGIAASSLAVAALLFALTPLQGTAGYVVFAVLLYAVSQTVVSFSFEGRRHAVDRLFTTLIYLAFVLAALPLISITWYTVSKGIGSVTAKFLTTSMFRVNPEGPGGGIYHAIIGTLEQSLLATVIAAPLGILAAVYLVEYGGRRLFARTVSFFVDVMTGVPSIVAGLFVYAAWILVLGFQKSGFAGALALFILMLPTVIRSTEEMLKLVPNELREASYALGVPKWRTIMRIVLPTAASGIMTGVMLGLARIMGETAPLLLLVGINQRIQLNPFAGHTQQVPQESLPTFIFEQFQVAVGNTQSPAFQRAWGAALVLIVIIGLLNLFARLIARFTSVR
ncbi:MAG TPA: phosphate ABC transporter permease PstA [Mycobacteriales bacterium]|nr:phosphate ABC transporter permease PstA [Mycobacteriales bacterium]